jgi:CO/xanthine dehydrogenase FAD-binding subunit
MSPSAYLRPNSAAEVVEALEQHGDDAKIVAGGQSLALLLRLKLVPASTLVGLDGVAELAGLAAAGDTAHIGARITHRQVANDPGVRARWLVLAEAAGAVATPQIRNVGTLCGNAAHGYALADPPAALLALNAQAHVRNAAGERTIAFDHFFVDFMTTALGPTDLLTHISIATPPPRSGGAYEVFRLRALDYPTVGVAVQLSLDEVGRCAEARVGLNGAAPIATRARRAEEVLRGQALTPETLRAAAAEASAECDPSDDVDGSASYKRRLVGVLLRRAAERAAARARGEQPWR